MRSYLLAIAMAIFTVGCQSDAPGLTIRGTVTAGPVCGVVMVEPNPPCDDKPVAGAEIVIRNPAGESVARVRSAEDGSFAVSVVEGWYELLPQPVEGLLGTAEPVEVVVQDGIVGPPIAIVYDTGIR